MDILVPAFVILFLLLFLGVPIAFGLLLVGTAGFAIQVGWAPALAVVAQVTTDTAYNYNFSVLPLFVLMGNLISHSRIADDLYAAANAFLGHRRGGLAMATILACGGFSAVSGSSLACAATMTKVAVPTMRRYGYNAGFAAGTVAAGGTLGILIPPSVPMVIYAFITTEVDIGKLFIAGILPGLLTIACYITVIWIVTTLRPGYGPPATRLPWSERWPALNKVWSMVALFLFVLGGIYFGAFTPTEAAGIGALGAFSLAVLRRTMSLPSFENVMVDCVRTSAMLFTVLVGALIFEKFVTVTGLPNRLETWIGGLRIGQLEAILIMLGIYLVLGCLLEGTSMILLTIPVFYPVVKKLGIDPIWFGIFVVMVAEVGLITPPIGMNVFVVGSLVPDVRQYTIFRGILPFLAADAVRIAIVIAFPSVVLLLPRLMS